MKIQSQLEVCNKKKVYNQLSLTKHNHSQIVHINLWIVWEATSVTHTKRIYRNLLRKETSFLC